MLLAVFLPASAVHFVRRLDERARGGFAGRTGAVDISGAVAPAFRVRPGDQPGGGPGWIPDQADWGARLTIAVPGCYRIDMLTDPGARPGCVASDGERLWRGCPERGGVAPPAPRPAARGGRPPLTPALARRSPLS